MKNNDLILSNLHLPKLIVNKHIRNYYDKDELLSVGYLELCELANRHDRNKYSDYQFGGYAYFAIRGRMYDYIKKKEDRYQKTKEKLKPVTELWIEDNKINDFDILTDIDIIKIGLDQTISEKRKEIIGYFLQGESAYKIIKDHNICPTSVYHHLRTFIKELEQIKIKLGV